MNFIYSAVRTASAFLLTYVSAKAGKSPHWKNDDDQSTDDRLFSMIKVFIKNDLLLYVLHFAQLGYYLNWAVYDSNGEPFSLIEVGVYSIALSVLSFRLWAMKTLGEFFTFEVVIRKNHQLITTGPYKYLMHPSYTGITFIHSFFKINLFML